MKWLSRLLGKTRDRQSSDNKGSVFDSEDMRRIISGKKAFEKDVETMTSEIFAAVDEFMKELTKGCSIDSDKETETFLTLFPLFVHIHDRVLFTRFGNKARSLYIDYIANKVYEMFKIMVERDGRDSEMDFVVFQSYLNQGQLFFAQFPELISDSHGLSKNLLWNSTKLLLQNIKAEEDVSLIMRLYTLVTILSKNFSVHRIKSII